MTTIRESNHRRTLLSPKGYLSGRAATLSRVAHLSCLLVLLTATFCAVAQNGVTVSNLEMDAGTVTFHVSWKNTDMPTPWSDTVWVFVDYNNKGKMERLPLLPGATLTATSAPGVGAVEQLSDNNKGVWVVGNARSAGSFSATVQLHTATATATGACVYASNYPPVGEYVAGTSAMSFTGTPMYNIILKKTADASTTSAFWNGNGAYPIPDGFTIKSFTDATGAPGMIKCIPMVGSLDFSVPDRVSKGQTALFAVTVQPSAPDVSAITYTWFASSFDPDSFTGTPFNTIAPATANTYSMTLTVRSEGYCNLSVTKDVNVLDCINPATYTLLASASSFCMGSMVGVTFALPGTQDGVTYQLYRDASVLSGATVTGTGSAATFTSGGPFNETGTYTARSVNAGQYCEIPMGGTHTVTSVPLLAPMVVEATFCFGLPGQLQATAPDGGTIKWYNASAGGDLLYTGDVLPLAPLYNDLTQYYAQAVSADLCESPARTQAVYTVNNCMMGSGCPGYTAGNVGSSDTPAACAVHYSGQIGAADYPAACVSHHAGRIGRSQ